MISRSPIVLGLLILAMSAGVEAQGLGDAAQKEKERRAKLQGARPAKPITEDDLLTTGEGTGTVSNPGGAVLTDPGPYEPSGTSARAPLPGTRAPSGNGESYWRARASQARAAVAAAEARLRELEARDKALGPRTPGPRSAACQIEGPTRGSGLKKTPPGAAAVKVCNAQVLAGQEQDRIYAEMERTRANLDRSRRALANLDEEARRAGALPGWLR